MELVGETRCSRELPILLHSKNESAKYHKIFKKKKNRETQMQSKFSQYELLETLSCSGKSVLLGRPWERPLYLSHGSIWGVPLPRGARLSVKRVWEQ